MLKRIPSAICLLLSVVLTVQGQGLGELRQRIERIVDNKDAIVGVAIQGPKPQDTLTLNGGEHFPMQSVFKFHIALKILSEVDQGNLSLDQNIRISKAELLPGLWSPIREKYPDGVTLTLREILEYTVSLSDNAGCDLLLNLLKGPQVVEDYFASLGFNDLAIEINEEVMQGNWELQFLNWTTPSQTNEILEVFYQNSEGLLSPSSYDFFWGIMAGTKTGKKRLRGQLPENTVVAHKTGWSGKHRETGITAATNDVGVIHLPNGEHLVVSIYITQSKEALEVNERMIAAISKAAWDYFAQD